MNSPEMADFIEKLSANKSKTASQSNLIFTNYNDVVVKIKTNWKYIVTCAEFKGAMEVMDNMW